MFLSADLRTLLAIEPSDHGDAFAAVAGSGRRPAPSEQVRNPDAAPAALGEPAALPSRTPAALVRSFVGLLESPQIRQLPHRERALKAWIADLRQTLHQAGMPHRQVHQIAFALDAMRKAHEVLQPRLATARQRLDDPADPMAVYAAEAGVDTQAVRAQLDLQARRLLERLEPWALQGQVVFWLVPSDNDLLGTAVLKAWEEKEDRRSESPQLVPDDAAATTTAVPTTTTRTTPVTTVATTEASTSPVTSLVTTPAPTPQAVAPTQPKTPFPRPATEAEALQALRHFKAHWRTLLPQFQGNWADLTRLSLGFVTFPDRATLAATFPCASRLDKSTISYPLNIIPPGAPRHQYFVHYPQGDGPFAKPTEASVGGVTVQVARFHATDRVDTSDDRVRWTPTGIFTSPQVEAAKLKMWQKIFHDAKLRALELYLYTGIHERR